MAGLKDTIGKAIIAKRIESAESGKFGDCEPVGEGVSEMRIHYGPGYADLLWERPWPRYGAYRGQGRFHNLIQSNLP